MFFAVTIVSGIIMFLLFASEFGYYLTTEVGCSGHHNDDVMCCHPGYPRVVCGHHPRRKTSN